MAYGTVNADVISTSTSGGVLGAGNASIMKNRIINGAMVIDQRNAGASVTPTDDQYTLDRWRANCAVASKFSVQQSTTAPVGFVNSLLVTSLSAYTVGSTDYFGINQQIEGYNTADLGWGTANAKTVTISFWVQSSLTGTFGGSIRNEAVTRSYPFSYTISSANTWEYKTVTVAGDTSGTWVTNNGIGIRLQFGLGNGSSTTAAAGSWASGNYGSANGCVSVVGTNGATLYITAVQLEVGANATGFEYRLYNQELSACQRYYETSGTTAPTNTNGGFTGMVYVSATQAIGICNFKVTKRADPTVTLYSASGGAGAVLQNGIADNIAATAAQISVNGFTFANRTSGNFNTSYGYPVTAGYTASAEL